MKRAADISRYLLGVLFILSGLLKANDPLGFSYKLEEFYEVFGHYTLLQWFDTALFLNTTLEAAVFMCVLEIALGFGLLSGALPRLVSWVSLLLMIWFTFLTAFAAITGEVTDCGCFGDAIKLTPWESFWKDIIILAFLLPVFISRKQIRPFRNRLTANLILAGGIVASLAFALHTLNHLPLKDFRPYAAGSNICENRIDIPDKLKFFYRLKNKQTGEEQEFERFPADYETNWEFIDTRTEVLEPGVPAKIQNFRLTTRDGEDLTDSLLELDGYKLFIVCYNIRHARQKKMDRINALAKAMTEAGGRVWGVTASSDADIDRFVSETGAGFPWLVGDETELKTMVRSNPGLILLRGCEILAKWHWRDTPSFEKVRKKYMAQ